MKNHPFLYKSLYSPNAHISLKKRALSSPSRVFPRSRTVFFTHCALSFSHADVDLDAPSGTSAGPGSSFMGNASQVPTTLNSANNPEVLNIPQKDCVMTSLMVMAPSLNWYRFVPSSSDTIRHADKKAEGVDATWNQRYILEAIVVGSITGYAHGGLDGKCTVPCGYTSILRRVISGQRLRVT